MGAVARRVGLAVVGAKAVSRVSLLPVNTRLLLQDRQTHTGGLGLQLVETHAILEHADERVRLDIGRKRQRFGVADPAARQLQRGIAEAGLLEVSPDCATESVVCVPRRMAKGLCGEREGYRDSSRHCC